MKTLNEMAKVGSFSNYDVIIHSNPSEGHIPHFHIYKNNKNIGGIEITSPKYFDALKLSKKEIKELISFLEKSNGKINNFEKIILFWNGIDLTNEVPDNIKMPDYTLLNE